MKTTAVVATLAAGVLAAPSATACIPSGDGTAIQSALTNGKAGTTVQLCPSSVFQLNQAIQFTAGNQEISTQGYPTDSTRAILKVSDTNTNNMTTILYAHNVDNTYIRNVVLDGNRQTLGYANVRGVKAGANIEVGGISNGILIDNVVSKNTRSWSCLHVIESGNVQQPCTNATITNNQIGPCGTADFWADGISFACSNSLVANNNIFGPTDGGIVIFGAPNSTIKNNNITGSPTQRGFGGINMVDRSYNGSYQNVQVLNNTITGGQLFDIGIAIGSSVWSSGDSGSYYLTGPANVDGNTISGQVAFAVAVNGWQGGLNVTNTNLQSLVRPAASFADAFTSCNNVGPTWGLFINDTRLASWPPNIKGQANLPGFIAAAQDPNNFLCPIPALSSTKDYAAGTLNIAPDQGVIASLHKGVYTQFQGDNNVVTLNFTGPNQVNAVWASGHTVNTCAGGCSLNFTAAGNLVNYVNGTVRWQSSTAGKYLRFINAAPWIQVLDATNKTIWDTTQLR